MAVYAAAVALRANRILVGHWAVWTQIYPSSKLRLCVRREGGMLGDGGASGICRPSPLLPCYRPAERETRLQPPVPVWAGNPTLPHPRLPSAAINPSPERVTEATSPLIRGIFHIKVCRAGFPGRLFELGVNDIPQTLLWGLRGDRKLGQASPLGSYASKPRQTLRRKPRETPPPHMNKTNF